MAFEQEKNEQATSEREASPEYTDISDRLEKLFDIGNDNADNDDNNK